MEIPNIVDINQICMFLMPNLCRRYFVGFLLLTANFFFIFYVASAQDRQRNFDKGWQFFLGAAKGAENFTYDDKSWRVVNLPHDWSIEPLKTVPDAVGPFSRTSPGGPATGQTLGGEGWYRKTFTLTGADIGKRYELYFEGVYNQSEIWINGKKAYFNAYGYTSFRFDITKYCNLPGRSNVIAVRVTNTGKNSRWYSGSGIYRHVWMIRTDSSFIEDWGTLIKTVAANKDAAQLSVSAKVVNSGRSMGSYTLKTEILQSNGKIISRAQTILKTGCIDTSDISLNLRVNRPSLWSVDQPNLYLIRISLWNGNKRVDQLRIPYGIRTIGFSAKNGFELNGLAIKLKGGCVHHDHGLLGAMAFDRAEERKVELLKHNGFNAVRTSHNPMSEGFMAACDRLGMLVINEAFDQWKQQKNPDDYHKYFQEWNARDIRSLVLRDRNHPSVIMWSIGNEIRERATEKGRAIAEQLRNEVRKYDDTRPVTAGVNKQWDKEKKNMLPLDLAFQHLDVAGYNYMWRFYEEEHGRFPQRVMFGSESVANEAAQNWDMVERHPYIIGDFIWTAQDYLGESGLGNSLEVAPEENVPQFMGWPWFNAWCGDIDLLGFKKPQSYYRDVVWRLNPITMAVEVPAKGDLIKRVSFWGWPEESLSWTFPGKEGTPMKVNVYSRAGKVRLYQDNILVGEQPINNLYKASFKVPYRPGSLKAVALSGDEEKSAVIFKTIGEAVRIRLKSDQLKLKADGQDLAFVTIELLDKDENLVMDSSKKIELSVTGNGGTIIGSGTASPNDMHSFGSMNPTLFNGRAMVIIRAGYQPGQLKLNVSSAGLPASSLKLVNLVQK